MNKNQFLDKIIKDWKAIVICIGVSLIIYLAYQTTTLDKKTFVVPLDIHADGTMVPAQSVDSYRYVKVSVRAQRDQLASVSDSDFTASLDLGYITKAGQSSIPVVVHPNARVLLMEPLEILASPEYITLAVDENIVSYVPVEPTLTGSPAYGYEVTGFSCEPEYLKVSGPAAQVSSVRSVQTGSVVIEGLTAGAEFTAPVEYDNQIVRLEDAADSIAVSVTVEPVVTDADFAGVPVAVTALPSGFEATLGTASVTVTARGRLLLMDTLRPSGFTARADCSFVEEEGTYEVPVVVSPPIGVTVVSQDAATVTVTVSRIRQEEGED